MTVAPLFRVNATIFPARGEPSEVRVAVRVAVPSYLPVPETVKVVVSSMGEVVSSMGSEAAPPI
jgi:hypothetical protein